MSLGAVDKHIVQGKFLGDTHRRKDIVGAVTVEMGFKLPLEQGDKRLGFHIEFGEGLLVFRRGKLVGKVTLRLEKSLADNRGGSHSGHGSGVLVGKG